MADKEYISAEQLQLNAYQLGAMVLESGFCPDLLIGLWRGGAPIALAMHELLNYCQCHCEVISLAVSSYQGATRQRLQIDSLQLNFALSKINTGSRILLVDDVHDSGHTLAFVCQQLKLAQQDYRIAVPYFKPTHSEVDFRPHFYLQETDNWLVFPHELETLSLQEISQHKTAGNFLADIISRYNDDRHLEL